MTKKIMSLLLVMIIATSMLSLTALTTSAHNTDTAKSGEIIYISGDYQYRILSDGTAEISYYDGSAENVIIPSTIDTIKVTSIGYHSFFLKTSIKSVIIPDSVTIIGEMAFYSCYGLTNVTIGNSVTRIVKLAFYDCTALKSLTIPKSVTSIDNYSLGYYSNENWAPTISTDFTIYGAKDSAAQKYASDYGINFVEKEEILIGDADGDSSITVMDTTTIQMQVANISPEKYVEKAADIDKDSNVTIMDATIIQMYLAMLPTNTDIGKVII